MAKITTIRFTDEEWSIIEKEVGDTSMSKYIKDKLFNEDSPFENLPPGYKRFITLVLQEIKTEDWIERLIHKARCVKNYNSTDPIEYGKGIAKAAAVLMEDKDEDKPDGWTVQQTPNGDTAPYYSDDLNKLILVLEKQGQRPLTIDESHPWWKHFTV